MDRETLAPLIEVKRKITKELEQLSRSATALSEEDYRVFVKTHIEKFGEHITRVGDLLRQIDAALDAGNEDIAVQVQELQEEYEISFEVGKEILELIPPDTWDNGHDLLVSAIQDLLLGHLMAVDIWQIDDTDAAKPLLDEMKETLKRARQNTAEQFQFIVAGKQLRYGQINLSQALSNMAEKGVDLSVFEEMGKKYFEGVLERNSEELPRGHGFHLTIWAILAETLNSPGLLKERGKAVASLLKRADTIDRSKLLAVTSHLQDDILRASRLLMNLGATFQATDMSKLHPPQLFEMLLNAYQRMSEGSLKSLINILLFAEELADGKSPNYEEIRKRNFGPKIRRYSQRGAKSIADASDPLIASLADDLIMYIRHADAHCDFNTGTEKVSIPERHHQTKDVITTHEYTLSEFGHLLRELMGAVFAILFGILCFKLELHETYLLDGDIENLSDYEKSEVCKLLFGATGIIIDNISASEDNQGHYLHMSLVWLDAQTPFALTTGCVFTSHLFPEVTHYIFEMYLEDDNLLGKVTLPADDLPLDMGNYKSSLAKSLSLTGNHYRFFSQQVEPQNLFSPNVSEEELYYWYFFRGLITYLSEIAMECYQMVGSDKVPTFEELEVIKEQLEIFEEILLTNEPTTNEFIEQHSDMMQAIKIMRRFIKAKKRFLRSIERGKKTNDLRPILSPVEPLRKKLWKFLQDKGYEKIPKWYQKNA